MENAGRKQTPSKAYKLMLLIFFVLGILLIIAVVVISIYFVTQGLPLHEAKPWLNSSLPRNLVPVHYEVDLKPILTPDASGTFWFNGSSKVTFTVKKKMDKVLIHSRDLDYNSLKLTSEQGADIPILKDRLYKPNDFLVIEMGQDLDLLNYTLETSFVGKLRNDNTGLYRSQYKTAAGNTKIMVASQMQATYARETFPCFDEPEWKATYDVYLWHRGSNFALSNMPAEKTESKSGGWNRTKFKRTPKISSYLLAFIVCDFKYTQSQTNTTPSIQTRIYATPYQADAGNVNFANEITPQLLEFYTEFFQVAYPLPKADQIAVPSVGVFSAMENWGLVIYKEAKLLYDKSANTIFSKQDVARIVAHELAHQWFGNIISPLWWDEIWLNEGFATYLQYLGVNRVEPSWKMTDQFVIKDFHKAMAVDGLSTSRPIVKENVVTKDQIAAMFDAISYAKGACIIRMIRAFAGDEAFRLGLKNYLNDNSYMSVTHQQLFQYWEKAINDSHSGSNPPGGFVNAMNTWVLQMGFPTVYLERDCENPNNVLVTQKRFLLDSKLDLDRPLSRYTWVIPFWFAFQSNFNSTLIWLLPEADTIINVPKSDFVIGNYEVFGYYRVNYDPENWKRIIAQLNENYTVINAKNRGQLIDDAFNLARSGSLPYATALNLTKFLRQDFSYISWKSAADAFLFINKMLARSKVYKSFATYLLELIEPSFKLYGWNEESGHLKMQVSYCIAFVCGYAYPVCISIRIVNFPTAIYIL